MTRTFFCTYSVGHTQCCVAAYRPLLYPPTDVIHRSDFCSTCWTHLLALFYCFVPLLEKTRVSYHSCELPLDLVVQGKPVAPIPPVGRLCLRGHRDELYTKNAFMAKFTAGNGRRKFALNSKRSEEGERFPRDGVSGRCAPFSVHNRVLLPEFLPAEVQAFILLHSTVS